MPVEIGKKLGRYEVRSKLGEGGMGAVYLAHDAGLDRNVALKILPSDLAAKTDRMERFVREAKAAAALNHPNIAHIYEIGESDGINFIAMEFVDGETLRQVIHARQADLKKLLRYMQKVAEGLSKAHQNGIVHRDLKPDNVMITHDGYAKILDFGLAKLIEPQLADPSKAGGEEQITAIMPQQSLPGVIMGTPGYMSPEQAMGNVGEIDHRSDIFSFGCILFEVATRQKPFGADNLVKALHKVIYEPAPLIRDLNPAAPADLQRIVRRCLAKDPDDRYQTIKDVAIELRELRGEMNNWASGDSSMPSSPSGAGAPVTQPMTRHDSESSLGKDADENSAERCAVDRQWCRQSHSSERGFDSYHEPAKPNHHFCDHRIDRSGGTVLCRFYALAVEPDAAVRPPESHAHHRQRKGIERRDIAGRPLHRACCERCRTTESSSTAGRHEYEPGDHPSH